MRAAVVSIALGLAGCDITFGLDAPPPSDVAPDTDDAPIPSGLVAWYPFDVIDSGSTPDLAGSRDAVCDASGCPLLTQGLRAGAIELDGIDDVFVAPGTPPLTPGAATVGVWAAARGGGRMCAVSKPNAVTLRKTWQLCLDGGAAVLAADDATVTTQLSGPATTWHHLAFTWDRTILTLYVDGAAREAVTLAAFAEDASPLVIGGDAEGGTSTSLLHGSLDDLRVYDRALSAVELQALGSR